MEQMTQMFMSMMEAKARKDAPEIQRREEANRITKCLQIVLTKQGQFDGRKATKYLKEYWMEITIHKLSAKVAIEEFPSLVEPELKELITKFAGEANEDWKTFELKVKEEFRFEDPDRVTAVTFMNWVHEKDKNLGPQELLREFNRKYHQLSTKDVATINPSRGRLLVRAADANLRLELDNALDQIAPDAEEVTWEQAEAAIQKVTKQRKRREIGTEPEVPIIEVKKPSSSEVVKKEVKSGISETNPDIAALTDMISKLALSIQALEGKSRPSPPQGSSSGKTWNCLWCDSKEHQRRDCTDLSEALKLRHVKFVEGKIAYFESGEPVPLNISRGGMKVLVEQKLRDKVASVSTIYGDPSVYCLQISSQDQPSIENIGEVEKRRLAEVVRRKSG